MATFALAISKKGSHLQEVNLSAQSDTVVGRQGDLLVDHKSISRKHAVFIPSGGVMTLVDLGGTHGTRVNDVLLSSEGSVQLKDGDTIVFGKSSRSYRLIVEAVPPPLTQKVEADVANPPPIPERAPVPAPAPAPATAPVPATATAPAPSSTSTSREDREREIAKMTASFGLPATMPSNSVKQEEGDSSSDDDDNFGPQPVKPAAGASGGHIKKEKEEEAESLDSVARRLKVPISHVVELGGTNTTTNNNSSSSHGKQGGGAVLCLSGEPSGSRLVAGYRDGTVKLFDFGGMDQDLAPFRVVSPGDNGQGASVVSHSSSGDRVFVSVSSAQGLLLSREGEALAKCIRGDMYLADLSNTKGHTSEVLCAQWHPTAANIVLTGGYDGTLRVWDVTSNLYLNMLTNKSVLKVRSRSGGSQARVPVNSCCYSSDGKVIVAGCADGSVHIWDTKILSRTKAVLRCPGSSSSSDGGNENDDSSVSYVTVLPPSQAGGREVLVAKTHEGNVYFWELRGAHIPGCKPFLYCGGCPNDSPGANVAFSADGSLMAVTSSSSHDNKKRPPMLHFFATRQLQQQKQKDKNESSEPLRPLLAIGLTGNNDVGAQAGPVLWQGNTNQIFVSMSSGAIKSFYDPSVSTKGVLLSVNKAPPRSKSNSSVDFSNGCVGEIYTPHALPMFKDDFASKMKGQGENSVASKARAPDNSHLLAKSAQQQQQAAVPVVSQVTKYIVSGHKVENLRAEDPREALLKMAEKAKDGMYMGGAYGKTQPTTILAAKTIEQEQEEQERETKRQRKG